MTDFAIDFVLAAIDSDIGDWREALAYRWGIHRRQHADHRIAECAAMREAHGGLIAARTFRSQIVRTSGWKPRLAA